MITDVVLGCTYGDEGKGKVVYHLVKDGEYDLCVRFNGSCNAGHTVYIAGVKHVLHSVPVGILHPDTHCLISSDCVINIDQLRGEVAGLEEAGIKVSGRLFVSGACHVITPELIAEDRATNVIGTTNSGNGPTYSRKMLRTGIRAEMFRYSLEERGIIVVNSMVEFWEKTDYRRVLLEGAQGFGLDINWTNMYPYCTSSSCGIGGALNTGVPLSSVNKVYGVAKAYDTYVGAYGFQPALYNETLNKIGDAGHEYGSTTGRRRQCNFLNLTNLANALKMNSCNICVINKCDVLETVGIYNLYWKGVLFCFETLDAFKEFIVDKLGEIKVYDVVFSGDPGGI